jgi:hypothetical protein
MSGDDNAELPDLENNVLNLDEESKEQRLTIFSDVEMREIVNESVDKIVKNLSDNLQFKNMDGSKQTYNVLRKIKINCLRYSIYHNKRYQYYKNIMLFAFRLPIIILSAFNSFFAVGLDGMVEQNTISIANAIVSLGCGILTSIELLLNLQKKIELETETYKNYYKLGMDIYRFIENNEHTKDELQEFTEEVYNRYQAIINISIPVNIFRLGFKDELCKEEDIEKMLMREASLMNLELQNKNNFCFSCFL